MISEIIKIDVKKLCISPKNIVANQDLLIKLYESQIYTSTKIKIFYKNSVKRFNLN